MKDQTTFGLALGLFKTGKYREAIQYFLAADSTEKQAQSIAYYLGLSYARLDEYEKAILYLEQVVSSNIHPMKLYQCRFALAYLYESHGKPELAERELSKLLKNGYESVQIYATKAHSHYKRGDVNRAIETYQKALALDPENSTSLNSLGYILCETDQDLSLAFRYVKKALQKKSTNPAYLDSMGWVYYKMNNLKEAKTWLSRAIALAPSDPEIRNHYDHVTKAMAHT